MRYLNLVVILVIALSLFIPLASAEDTGVVGWVWNGITDLWEYFFGGEVIETSETQPLGLFNEDLGQATIQSTGEAWTVTEDTEEDLFYFSFDKNSQKSKHCVLSYTAENKQDLADLDFGTADEINDLLSTQNKIKADKVKAEDSGLDRDYYGYCFEVEDNEKKLKFGSNSITTVYQDQNQINYQLDFADVNVSLSCEDVAQNDIFIYENPDNYKFGANGTFEGLKNCSYTIESSVEIIDNVWSPYIVNPEKFDNGSIIYDEVHVFDFTDVCFKFYNGISANCEFNWTGNNKLEVSFISDNDIDPNIKAEAKYEKKGNELSDNKTYVQDVFDLGNGQTNYNIHIGDINYKKYGGFTSINTTLIWNENERVWEQSSASYYGKMPEYSDDLVVFFNAYEGSNSFISAYPIAEHVQGFLQPDKKSVLYEDAFGSEIDLNIYAEHSGLKKVIIINEKPLDTSQNLTFDFELNIPLSTKIKDRDGNVWDKEATLNFKDKTLLIGQEGKESYFSNAFLWDSDNLIKPVDIELYKDHDKIYLRKTITSEILEKAAYPLYTDHPTTYDVASGDAITINADSSWDAAHDETTCDAVNTGFIFPNVDVNGLGSSFTFYKAYIPIDTSAIDDGATVTAATLHMYITGKGVNSDDGNDYIAIVSADGVAADNLLAVEDCELIGDSVDDPTEAHDVGERMDISATDTSQWITWDFNANALDWVSKTGYTKLGAREGHDIEDDNIGNGNGNYAIFAVSGSGTAPYLNVTVGAGDTEYPIFSDYWDDNATLIDSGTGHFNVTVLNTNGTVLLEINGTNVTATNLSASVYNVSYDFVVAGDYPYKWHSWGNGTSENYNVSEDRSYTVNSSVTDSCTYSGSGDWEVNCSDNCLITSNVDLLGNGMSIIGIGTFLTSANITNFTNLYTAGVDVNNICRITCFNGGCFQ